MKIKLKDNMKIIITLIFMIGVMVMIFLFSSQNVAASDGLSGKITGVVVKVYKFIADTFGVDSKETGKIAKGKTLFENVNHYVRKLAHITEFALLGISIILHSKAGRDKRNKKMSPRMLVPVILTGAFYAATDEIHQLFVEGRGCEFKDFAIDTSGVVFGSVLVFIILHYVNKKRSSNAIETKTQNGQSTKG